MKICPNCNESYTYFNSYFGVEMCTNCWWSEDVESYIHAKESDFSNESSQDKNNPKTFKETKKEKIAYTNAL